MGKIIAFLNGVFTIRMLYISLINSMIGIIVLLFFQDSSYAIFVVIGGTLLSNTFQAVMNKIPLPVLVGIYTIITLPLLGALMAKSYFLMKK